MEMVARIVGNCIVYNEKSVCITDFLDESFYKRSDAKADEFYNDSYGVNELYSGFVQPYWVVKEWVEQNNPNVIDISKADPFIKYYVLDACSGKPITIKGKRFVKVFDLFSYYLTTLASPFYIALKFLFISYNPEKIEASNFAVLRSKASIKKFSKFKEIYQEVESLYDKNSIYRLFTKRIRFKWAFLSLFNSFASFSQMKKFYTFRIGPNFKYVLITCTHSSIVQ